MKNSAGFFLIAFFLLSIINLIFVYSQWQTGIYLSKPFLLTTLACWFYLTTKRDPSFFRNSILAGLTFSIVGDCFMMFSEQSPLSFILGLGSFLVTHLFYTLAFIKFKDLKNGLIFKKYWPIFIVLAYLTSFLYYLWPDLEGSFKIPVLVYSIVISTMLVLSINMTGRTKIEYSRILLAGALLFVVSDSVIAIKKFKIAEQAWTFFGLLIMVTYLTGQYLIAKSCADINKDN